MKKLNIITFTDNVKKCEQIEVDDELFEFLNIKVNCITKELFEEKLFHYVKKVYSEDERRVRTDENERPH